MDNANLLFFVPVLDVTDDDAGLRIKVRLPHYDDPKTPLSELPYVFPLVPKFLHINPKVNELVAVILQSIGAGAGDRFFIGPFISQPQMLNNDPAFYSAQSLFTGQQISKPLPSPFLDPENEGTLPDREDIALLGRGDADIILKEDEVRIRCGHKSKALANKKECLNFNKEDLSYIQLKYEKTKDAKGNEYSSVINIVADRINLLSHDSGTYFNLGNNKDLITNEEMKKILDKAHKLPYGDLLIKFISDFIRVFENHTHPFPGDPPDLTEPDIDVLRTPLDNMLSQSVRIN